MTSKEGINMIVALRNLARDLALALADEAMYVESLSRDGSSDPPSEYTLQLLARARTELHLERQFDELDNLKPMLARLPQGDSGE